LGQLSTNPPTGKRSADDKKLMSVASVADITAKVKAMADVVEGVGFLLHERENGLERFLAFLDSLRKLN
jgi:hypothetical protein